MSYPMPPIAGPLSRVEAYALAESHPRDDVPRHIHSFSVLPGDMVKDFYRD